MRIDALGEDGLLQRIFPFLPTGVATKLGPGDDAALICAGRGEFLVSTDVLVEDTHFRAGWSTGFDVGWKAAVQNLADIAAMGGTPTAMTVGLAMPGSTEVAWVEDFARGMAEVCGPLGVGVVGGDLCVADRIMVSVTVHGDPAPQGAVTRAGAHPGDVLALAGYCGWSAAGLELLSHPGVDGAHHGDPATLALIAQAITCHRRPVSPLAAGPEAAAAGATAMMDVSDGLIRDAGRMAKASGVTIDIDTASPTLAGLTASLVPLAQIGEDDHIRAVQHAKVWVLTGGEDHPLLATFPQAATTPAGFHVIGKVSSPHDAAGPAVLVDATEYEGPLGWDHFASPKALK